MAASQKACMRATPRAICFDLDNTLWDVAPVIARAEAELHAWFERHYPAITARYSLEQMRAHRQTLMAELPQRAHDLSFIRTESIAIQAESVGYSRELAQEAFEVFYAARHRVEFFSDVAPALQRLRMRFKLASLSNGNADLRRIGVDTWFAVTASAGDIGFAKPHAAAFEYVASALGIACQDILYVGDDPHFDVEGARRAGMYTAWINRSGAAWPAGVEPANLVVSDLHELDRVLK
jgi:FMN hydrolase / 5-amino-6-(5-phospho-D-ribitylamino)uracil phosphatase